MLARGLLTDRWSFLLSHLQPSHGIRFFMINFPLWFVTVIITMPPLYQHVLYPLFYSSHNAAELWDRVTAEQDYCRFSSCTGYHWPFDESQCTMHDWKFFQNTNEQGMALHSCNVLWSWCVHSGNVFSENCESLNTRKNERFDGWYVVYTYSKAWENALAWFFLWSFPMSPMFLWAVGSTSIWQS